jgi:hypothetical protein
MYHHTRLCPPHLCRPARDPAALRSRANRYRDVARGVYDPRALAVLNQFIAELEAEADRSVKPR